MSQIGVNKMELLKKQLRAADQLIYQLEELLTRKNEELITAKTLASEMEYDRDYWQENYNYTVNSYNYLLQAKLEELAQFTKIHKIEPGKVRIPRIIRPQKQPAGVSK